MDASTMAAVEDVVECVEDGLYTLGFTIIDNSDYDKTTVEDMDGNEYEIIVKPL